MSKRKWRSQDLQSPNEQEAQSEAITNENTTNNKNLEKTPEDNGESHKETPDNSETNKRIDKVVEVLNNKIIPELGRLDKKTVETNIQLDTWIKKFIAIESTIADEMDFKLEEKFQKYMPQRPTETRTETNSGAKLVSVRELVNDKGEIDYIKLGKVLQQMLGNKELNSEEVKKFFEDLKQILGTIADGIDWIYKRFNPATGASVPTNQPPLMGAYEFVMKQAAEKEIMNTIKLLQKKYNIKLPKELLGGAFENVVNTLLTSEETHGVAH